MNAKACKALRRQMREQGIDPAERSYIVLRPNVVRSMVVLTPGCGRAVYQANKKLA